MNKPRKPTEKPAGAIKPKVATRQRKTGKRASESREADFAHSYLMQLNTLFDDLVKLYDELPANGVADVDGISETITSLSDEIRRVPGRGMDALRIKAKVARWNYRSNFEPECLLEEDCEMQWLAGLVEIVENLPA